MSSFILFYEMASHIPWLNDSTLIFFTAYGNTSSFFVQKDDKWCYDKGTTYQHFMKNKDQSVTKKILGTILKLCEFLRTKSIV
jgi:hypothetical protein